MPLGSFSSFVVEMYKVFDPSDLHNFDQRLVELSPLWIEHECCCIVLKIIANGIALLFSNIHLQLNQWPIINNFH